MDLHLTCYTVKSSITFVRCYIHSANDIGASRSDYLVFPWKITHTHTHKCNGAVGATCLGALDIFMRVHAVGHTIYARVRLCSQLVIGFDTSWTLAGDKHRQRTINHQMRSRKSKPPRAVLTLLCMPKVREAFFVCSFSFSFFFLVLLYFGLVKRQREANLRG